MILNADTKIGLDLQYQKMIQRLRERPAEDHSCQVLVAAEAKDSDMDCSQLRECRLIVTSSAPKLGGFQCRLGAGVAQHPAFGCLETCRNGVQLMKSLSSLQKKGLD